VNTNFATYFIITTIFSFLTINNSLAADLFAIKNGNWETKGTWATVLGGASCGCTPSAGDNVRIPRPFTVILGGNISIAINNLTIDNEATLNGNNTNLVGIVNSLTNNGIFTGVKNLGTGRLFNTGAFDISGKIDLTIQTGIIFNNSGTLSAKEMKEDFGRYPVPLGTSAAGTYPEFFNSGTMTLEKLQFDGYFTNETNGIINITNEIHVDGIICNRGRIKTEVLKMHGGTSNCAGLWTVEEIDFDTNSSQTGSNRRGELNFGDYCTASGMKPEINDSANGTISSNVTFCDILLPIELRKFNGIDVGGKVILSWTTLSEMDNERFEVLCSSTGTRFKIIGSVESKKNGNQTQDYQFEYIPENPGISYYQLRQVDTNGDNSLSKIIAVNYSMAEQTETIQVFPNPTTGSITLTYLKDRINQDLKGVLYNLQGVALKEIYLDKTKDKQEIDLSGLSAGIYILYFENGTRIRICKL
jgi:hypothetical protein